jgi:hypothetical protein
MRSGNKNMITKNYVTQNIRSMNNIINKFRLLSINVIERIIIIIIIIIINNQYTVKSFRASS